MLVLFIISYLLGLTIGDNVNCKEILSKWDADFSYNQYMNSDSTYKLHWTVGKDGKIQFGISVCNAGSQWIGMGFSPGTGMKNSHIIIGNILADGSKKLEAYKSSYNAYPDVATTQSHIELLSGEKTDGVLRFKFTYDNNCQENLSEDDDRYKIPQASNRIIWAFGEMKPDGKRFAKHLEENRLTTSVNILTGKVTTHPVLPAGTNNITILNDRNLTDADTEYACKLFALPNVSEKNHIIRMEPIIEKHNANIVHHFTVHICDSKAFETAEQQEYIKNTTSTICENYDYVEKHCGQGNILFAWAVGGNPVIDFPTEAGYPFGPGTEAKYVYMETHYDNPSRTPGYVDESGVRFHYTRDIRDNDVGVLIVGTYRTALRIPQKAIVTNYGMCDSSCTKTFNKPLNVFANCLHSHTTGYAMSLRQIRDGVELDPIDYNQYYDFNYQATRMFEKSKIIKQNDTLFVTCTFNTDKRENLTFGGESSRQEMCVSFLFYYPNQELGLCASGPSKEQTDVFFNTSRQKGYLTCEDPNNCNYNNYQKYNYSNPDAKKYYDDYVALTDNKTIEYACMTGNGAGFSNKTQIQPFKRLDYSNYEKCPISKSTQKPQSQSTDTDSGDNSTDVDSVTLFNFKISITISLLLTPLYFVF